MNDLVQEKTSLESETLPVTAAAATMIGLMSIVLPVGLLPALEISVARAGAELVSDEFIGVHGQAHGTSGRPPFKPRLAKDLIQSFLLSKFTHDLRSRNDDRLDTFPDSMPIYA